MLEIINRKRDGLVLTREEIQEVINGLVRGTIPDYQISAFLMALYFQGMNETETAHLTDSVLNSGDQIDLSDIPGIKVDKHSTGGVGDKTTLVLAPLVAAAGVPVAKMSGRGLGHTGGTIDKLESIAGFHVNMSIDTFVDKVKEHGIAICGQSANLVPADKMLYALRDVTGTVKNPALITSSIMSKKLAGGADAIVIDMKVGRGAYMSTIEEAEKVAQMMIKTGTRMDRKVVVIASAMDQPLGYTVGNALEVKEAIATLQGRGPADLTALCMELGGHMLMLAGRMKSHKAAMNLLQELIENGKAWEKFRTFIQSQGGDINMIDQPQHLPQATYVRQFNSTTSGFVSQLDAEEIGLASVQLGAGRETKDSELDFAAGIVLKKKVGDPVVAGESLAELHANDESAFEKAQAHMENAYKLAKSAPTAQPLIIKRMS